MPITLTNRLVSGPLIVPLSSGASLRLSPGQTSSELQDVEIAANPALDKLVQRGLVEVQRLDGEEEPAVDPPEAADAEPEAAAKPEQRPARSRGGRSRSKPDAGGPDAPTSGDT